LKLIKSERRNENLRNWWIFDWQLCDDAVLRSWNKPAKLPFNECACECHKHHQAWW